MTYFNKKLGVWLPTEAEVKIEIPKPEPEPVPEPEPEPIEEPIEEPEEEDGSVEVLACPHCDKQYVNRYHYTKHIETKHPGMDLPI